MPAAGENSSSTSNSLHPVDVNGLFATTAGVFSISVWDLANQSPLMEHHSELPLIPASNQKIITIASALLQWEADFQSRMEFLTDGKISGEILQGNLIIRGNGAIVFSSRYPQDATYENKNHRLQLIFDALVEQFQLLGIHTINGEIQLNDDHWTDIGVNPHYPAAASVSFNENTIEIGVKNGQITTCPRYLGGVEIQTVYAPAPQCKSSVDQGPHDIIEVNPLMDSDDFWRVERIPAAAYFKAQLTHSLRQNGIVISGKTQSKPDKDILPMRITYNLGNVNLAGTTMNHLFSLPGLPLRDILIPMGIFSDNFRAELMFLNLGYAVFGKANYHNGARATRDILSHQGLSLKHFNPKDGSGLDRGNTISTSNMVSILNHMLASPHQKLFLECFPIAGISGTLQDKLKRPEITGRILGKTGTLSDVTSLSGFVLNSQRLPALSFSFIANQVHDQAAVWHSLEILAARLVDFASGPHDHTHRQ